jgi:L-iditol 2-dehydrogenase
MNRFWQEVSIRYHRSMKALLLSEYSRLDVANVPMPRPGPDEVLIKVEACGICGSDVHGYDGSSGRRIPPLVMGHEASGVVAASGTNVTDLREGAPVTFDSTVYCGKCEYCERGQMNLCLYRQVLGVSTADFRREGAFAEYLVVPRHIIYSLPDGLAFTEAAMVEPLSVAVHAVAISELPKNSTALVIGAGMIGLLVLQVLRDAGCSTVIVSDVDDSRLKLAKDLGAAVTINAKSTDTAEEVRRHTGGLGADVALEAVGSTPTVQTAIESVRRGGTVTLIGNVVPTVEIPLQSVVSRQIRLQGSAGSSGEYPECIEMLASGRINVKPLISMVAPLEEGASWFSRLHGREANLMKVILTPGSKA